MRENGMKSRRRLLESTGQIDCTSGKTDPTLNGTSVIALAMMDETVGTVETHVVEMDQVEEIQEMAIKMIGTVGSAIEVYRLINDIRNRDKTSLLYLQYPHECLAVASRIGETMASEVAEVAEVVVVSVGAGTEGTLRTQCLSSNTGRSIENLRSA